jgi:hypothetical protein
MDHDLDRLRLSDLQPCRFGHAVDRRAPAGGRPVGLGLADPFPDGEAELGQPLTERREGAVRPSLLRDLLPERHERLVREREPALRTQRAEVEEILVVGQELFGFRRGGAEGCELNPSAHAASLKYLDLDA